MFVQTMQPDGSTLTPTVQLKVRFTTYTLITCQLSIVRYNAKVVRLTCHQMEKGLDNEHVGLSHGFSTNPIYVRSSLFCYMNI